MSYSGTERGAREALPRLDGVLGEIVDAPHLGAVRDAVGEEHKRRDEGNVAECASLESVDDDHIANPVEGGANKLVGLAAVLLLEVVQVPGERNALQQNLHHCELDLDECT